jgi:hypothetical protein
MKNANVFIEAGGVNQQEAPRLKAEGKSDKAAAGT